MLRIVFTTEDLGRVRIAERPDPLWETVLSVHQLCRKAPQTGPYSQWASWIRTIARDRVSPSGRVLRELAPPRRYFPDFLTPAAGVDGLDAGLDAVLHTPRIRLRAELAKAGRGGSLPSWAEDVADGKRERLRWLGTAMRRYHQQAIEPFQSQIAAQLEAHRSQLICRLVTGGAEAVLGSLGGGIRWERPALTARRYPADLSIELQGRGITLVPSFFCRHGPVTLADDSLDPVLVYPIDPPSDWLQTGWTSTGVDRHLGALVGQPRAQLLHALSTPAGTTEVSARTGMSISSASEHTAVLRNAGLVQSVRRGRRVVHSLTPLGRGLLAGDIA
jgi:DNA-binding transcriptional ArsR family regulator